MNEIKVSLNQELKFNTTKSAQDNQSNKSIKIFNFGPDKDESPAPAENGANRTVKNGNTTETYESNVLVKTVTKENGVITEKTYAPNGEVSKVKETRPYNLGKLETITENDTKIEKEYNSNNKLIFETKLDNRGNMLSRTQYLEDGSKSITNYFDDKKVEDLYDKRGRLEEHIEDYKDDKKSAVKKTYLYYGKGEYVQTIRTTTYEHGKVVNVEQEEFSKKDKKQI